MLRKSICLVLFHFWPAPAILHLSVHFIYKYNRVRRTDHYPMHIQKRLRLPIDQTTHHAVQHTLHCLLGCGIGETLGSAIGAGFGWPNVWQTVLAVVLAFGFGYGLTFRGARKLGQSGQEARGTALRTDTISIISMEIIDNLLEYLIPGAMSAVVASWLFWWSMALSLAVAFLVTVPVNRFMMVRFGIGHGHHGGSDDHSMQHH